MKILIGLVLLLIAVPLSLFGQEKTPREFPVLSYITLAVKDLDARIDIAEKKNEDWVFNPLLIAMKFHKVSEVRFVDIKQKNDRAECSLRSVITIVEEGFLDDQMRGRWTEFHLERKDCTKAWKVKEIRQAYLCGLEGSKEVFLKDLCPLTRSRKVTRVWVEMIPSVAKIPCDYFPYTFDVKFKITVDGPVAVTFQRSRSNGTTPPPEEIVFSEAGTKEFHDYYRVGKPGDYRFRVRVISPNPIAGESLSRVVCDDRR